jgi:hypothetical protein
MYRAGVKYVHYLPKAFCFQIFGFLCHVARLSKDRNLHASPGTISQGTSSPYERNQEATLRKLTMAKVISFYIPEGFKPPARWSMHTEPKVLKFRFEEIKKSA